MEKEKEKVQNNKKFFNYTTLLLKKSQMQ